MASDRAKRKLAAILAADIVGYNGGAVGAGAPAAAA
jgi:hypothetical protein